METFQPERNPASCASSVVGVLGAESWAERIVHRPRSVLKWLNCTLYSVQGGLWLRFGLQGAFSWLPPLSPSCRNTRPTGSKDLIPQVAKDESTAALSDKWSQPWAPSPFIFVISVKASFLSCFRLTVRSLKSGFPKTASRKIMASGIGRFDGCWLILKILSCWTRATFLLQQSLLLPFVVSFSWTACCTCNNLLLLSLGWNCKEFHFPRMCLGEWIQVLSWRCFIFLLIAGNLLFFFCGNCSFAARNTRAKKMPQVPEAKVDVAPFLCCLWRGVSTPTN